MKAGREGGRGVSECSPGKKADVASEVVRHQPTVQELMEEYQRHVAQMQRQMRRGNREGDVDWWNDYYPTTTTTTNPYSGGGIGSSGTNPYKSWPPTEEE